MALEDLKNGIHGGLTRAMYDLGSDIVRDMKSNLQAGGHIDTGALYESIRQETVENTDSIDTYIYADAESTDGTQYAEFIELGSGAAHGRPGGRVGTWRYKDRHGNWHTTDGMDADPFIEPAVDANIGKLGDAVKRVLYDVAKYRGKVTKI